jgi:hypothetical protein
MMTFVSQLFVNFEIENELEAGAVSKTVAGKTYIDYEKMRELGLERIE